MEALREATKESARHWLRLVPGSERTGRLAPRPHHVGGAGVGAVLRTRYVADMTEHHYSRQRRYDVLVPLIPRDGISAASSVLVEENHEWLAALDPPVGRVLVPVQVVQSTWYADDVVRETRHVLDNETLREIDQHLCALFGL
jgi:hypothetical protein